MNWFGQTLTRKFILLLAGFLLLQALQLGVGIFGILHVGEEMGALINDAGKQRFRTLLLGTMSRQAVASGGWTGATQETYARTLADYERHFSEFGTRTEEIHEYDALHALLTKAQANWEKQLKPLLVKVNPARSTEANALLNRYEALGQDQVILLDSAVKLLELDATSDTHRLAMFQATVLGLTLLLGVIGLVMARNIVALPLRRLTEGTRAIAAGAYDKRVTISSHDEIGKLAETFNHMAAAVGEKTSRISALNQIAVAISSTLGWRELLDRIMRSGIALTGSKAACLAFYDNDKHCFGEWHTSGLSDHFIESMSFRPGGLADKALASGKYILSNDRPESKNKLSELTRTEGIRCFICLPFISQTQPLGVLYLYRDDRDTFLPEEIELLATFSHLAAIAAENTLLHSKTVRLAETDALTGLLNRRAFEDRIKVEHQRSQRYGKAFSLMMLDIDHFKKVNDTYGHVAGDAVLKSLAAILTQQVRDIDSVARFGGEEFVIILPETDGSGAKIMAERIRKTIAGSPFTLPDGVKIDVTVSIGISCFPHCAINTEALLERADQALYLAKNSGRNQVFLYRELLQAELELNPGRIVQLLNESSENVKAVATAVNMKASHLRVHADMVERYALRLGKKLDLSAADTHTLGLAAVLHDIGYISIPENLLNKREAFTADEWKAIQQHPVTGAALLEQVPALREAASVVRLHHEWHDGGGYPDKLRGEAIPYLARILSVVDAYCAMTGNRPQRRAMKPHEARAILHANAGSQFDANIVKTFIEMLGEEP